MLFSSITITPSNNPDLLNDSRFYFFSQPRMNPTVYAFIIIIRGYSDSTFSNGVLHFVR